jgi:hypothetical protein
VAIEVLALTATARGLLPHPSRLAHRSDEGEAVLLFAVVFVWKWHRALYWQGSAMSFGINRF